MRRFYYGPGFGIPVEALLYTEIGASRIVSKAPPLLQSSVNNISEEDPQKDRMMTIFSTEARICSEPPGLCLQTKEIAVVARQNVPRMWPCRENGPVIVCKHLSTQSSDWVDIFTSYILPLILSVIALAQAQQNQPTKGVVRNGIPLGIWDANPG
jgi:hypothetical protein